MPMPDEWGDQPIPEPFETDEMKEERMKREAVLEKMKAAFSSIAPGVQNPE